MSEEDEEEADLLAALAERASSQGAATPGLPPGSQHTSQQVSMLPPSTLVYGPKQCARPLSMQKHCPERLHWLSALARHCTPPSGQTRRADSQKGRCSCSDSTRKLVGVCLAVDCYVLSYLCYKRGNVTSY